MLWTSDPYPALTHTAFVFLLPSDIINIPWAPRRDLWNESPFLPLTERLHNLFLNFLWAERPTFISHLLMFQSDTYIQITLNRNAEILAKLLLLGLSL